MPNVFHIFACGDSFSFSINNTKTNNYERKDDNNDGVPLAEGRSAHGVLPGDRAGGVAAAE